MRTPGVLDGAVLDSFAWSEFLLAKDRRGVPRRVLRTLVASGQMVNIGSSYYPMGGLPSRLLDCEVCGRRHHAHGGAYVGQQGERVNTVLPGWNPTECQLTMWWVRLHRMCRRVGFAA